MSYMSAKGFLLAILAQARRGHTSAPALRAVKQRLRAHGLGVGTAAASERPLPGILGGDASRLQLAEARRPRITAIDPKLPHDVLRSGH
jgi:hypothetical protein